MMNRRPACGVVVIAGAALVASGCAFQGVNSLPLPGAVGRGDDAIVYHIEIANVGALEANSPVMLGDVIVGSVTKLTFADWQADVDVAVKADVVVPVNAVATVGQTSLLGSMHLALDPPLDEQPTGRLVPGATIAIDASSTYPSTEQTLSSLAAVVNGGGLGQIGDIIHNANLALGGREADVRQLLQRLNEFVTVLDNQRDSITATIASLNRLAGRLANQNDVLDRTLQRLPDILDVLIRQRPQLVAALDALRTFSTTATNVVNTTQQDLVSNLQNLEPTLKALADVGPYLDTALAYATVYPFGQNLIDRGLRGDYMNLYAVLDLTVPRLKRTLFLGTRWGDPNAGLVPAPGEPFYSRYSFDPVGEPLTAALPPPSEGLPPVVAPPPEVVPVLPVEPPPHGAAPPPTGGAGVFAGPYPSLDSEGPH